MGHLIALIQLADLFRSMRTSLHADGSQQAYSQQLGLLWGYEIVTEWLGRGIDYSP